MNTAIALLLFVAVIAAIAYNARRAKRNFESYLEGRGFARQTSCPLEIVVREKQLREPRCWRGVLGANITGDVVAGYIHAAERRGYRYFLGVIIPASAHLDDAWLKRF